MSIAAGSSRRGNSGVLGPSGLRTRCRRSGRDGEVQRLAPSRSMYCLGREGTLGRPASGRRAGRGHRRPFPPPFGEEG